MTPFCMVVQAGSTGAPTDFCRQAQKTAHGDEADGVRAQCRRWLGSAWVVDDGRQPHRGVVRSVRAQPHRCERPRDRATVQLFHRSDGSMSVVSRAGRSAGDSSRTHGAARTERNGKKLENRCNGTERIGGDSTWSRRITFYKTVC